MPFADVACALKTQTALGKEIFMEIEVNRMSSVSVEMLDCGKPSMKAIKRLTGSRSSGEAGAGLERHP